MQPLVNPLAAIRQRITNAQQQRPVEGDGYVWTPGRDPLPEDAVCATCGRLVGGHPAVAATLAAKGIKDVFRYCECILGAPPTLDQARTDQRLRSANLPHADEPRTFDNFTPRRGCEAALAAARAFGAGEAPYHVLVLTGHAGAGKSHLLEAVARERLAHGQSVKYEHVPHLLDVLRDAYKDDATMGFLDVFSQYQGPNLLCLDDLGTETVSPWVCEKLTTLVDERYRNGHDLAVATNLLREDVAQAYHERLASRLWDANTGMVCTVTLTATDYRLKQK